MLKGWEILKNMTNREKLLKYEKIQKNMMNKIENLHENLKYFLHT